MRLEYRNNRILYINGITTARFILELHKSKNIQNVKTGCPICSRSTSLTAHRAGHSTDMRSKKQQEVMLSEHDSGSPECRGMRSGCGTTRLPDHGWADAPPGRIQAHAMHIVHRAHAAPVRQRRTFVTIFLRPQCFFDHNCIFVFA